MAHTPRPFPAFATVSQRPWRPVDLGKKKFPTHSAPACRPRCATRAGVRQLSDRLDEAVNLRRFSRATDPYARRPGQMSRKWARKSGGGICTSRCTLGLVAHKELSRCSRSARPRPHHAPDTTPSRAHQQLASSTACRSCGCNFYGHGRPCACGSWMQTVTRTARTSTSPGTTQIGATQYASRPTLLPATASQGMSARQAD